MKVYVDLLPGTNPSRIEAASGIIVRRESDTLVGSDGTTWLEVSSPAAIASAPSEVGLWLRGHECGGRVESYTALILIRAARKTGKPWVAAGLGPRGMAATLAVGAAGIVLDVALWAIDESPLSPEDKDTLAACTSGRDTAVIDGFRVLTRSAFGSSELPVPQSIGSVPLAAAPAQVIGGVKDAISDHLDALRAFNPLEQDPFGTGTPIVQGPMANVSEGTGLARAVAEEGALPFAALGALDPDAATEVLRAHSRLGKPWGVGVIGFDVMPDRDAHLAAIRALGAAGPTGVILAGGSPRFAMGLTEEGLPVWLHTPSARLARTALQAGISAVVFEGHEAGGHVGQLTSAGLWEEGLAAMEEHGEGLAVLAGGIGDETSAAFAAAMAAPAVRAGARIALQAGTAFLFTHEIREAGQITTAYQQAALRCRETVLVGATVNLPLRCAPNAFTTEALALEQRWLEAGISRSERREKLEYHNLGRTRIAAKGLQRNPSHAAVGPRYVQMPVRTQISDGAFSVGQAAGLCDKLQSVADLVQALTTGALGATRSGSWGQVHSVPGSPAARTSRPRTTAVLGNDHTSQRDAAIAVVGLGCVVPQALDIETFWKNLLDGVDAVGPIPKERWVAERYFDATAGTQGPVKSYARIAGSIQDFQFDPLAFRIPPRVMRTLDPSQRLALAASKQAVSDATWLGRVDRRRAAVILGNSMGGEYAKSLALRVRFREVLAALDEDELVAHLDDEERAALHERIEVRLSAGLPPVDVDSMPGLLSNVVAGRVASWLDWMGGNLTVDAACAASLAAVAVAVDWLRSGRCDAVLTGGVDTDLAPETFVGFCRTGALSHTGSTPFSTEADGFVMGEGCAVLALKRLQDALRDDDPVWAVIRGVGQSSDGRGRSITAPRAAGQRLALERAYAEADFGPESVGMVEAHGTGTALGDATEVAVLTDHFRGRKRTTWLGSVKSMLGHLKGGAGAAGLTKAVMAVATGTIPPTLHAGPLNPALGLDRGPFRLPRRPVRFPDDLPRASVSAFGFGGTNFHILVEAPPAEARKPDALERLRTLSASRVGAEQVAAWGALDRTPLVLCYGAETEETLIDRLVGDSPATPTETAAANYRVVVITDPARRRRDVDQTAAWLATGPESLELGQMAFRGNGPAVPVVVAVPGQGTQRPGAWDSVASLPSGSAALSALADKFDIESDGREPGSDPLTLHRSLYAVAVAWAAVLHNAELPIAAAVGHSLGELGALVVAGQLTPADGMALAEVRGRSLQDCAKGAMIAVQGDPHELAAAHGLVVAAENAPGRAVLSGPEDRVAAVSGRRLAVTRAFHSPAVAPAARVLAAALEGAKFSGGLPCYSVSSAAPFASPASELAEAITAPVRFAATIEALAEHGVFVELGPGRFLSSCISEILPNARCVPLDPSPGEPTSLVTGAAALLAAGHPGLLVSMPGSSVQIGHAFAHPRPADRPEAAVEPTAEAPVAEPSDVRDAVIAAICEITGYPRDFLDDSSDLEGDLGVDSIRKMEILGLLQEQLGFTTRESDYAALSEARISTIVAHVEARLADPEAEDATPPSTAHFYALREVAISEPTAGELDPLRYDCPKSMTPADVHRQVSSWMASTAKGPIAVVRGPEPAAAASAGFARSLGRERRADVRIITVHPDVAKETVAAEVAGMHRPAEVVLRPNGIFAVVQTPFAPKPGSMPSPVILATGGITGIVAACVEALADLSPRVLFIGRRAATVDHIAIDAEYRVCDLTDPAAVAAAVDYIKERWGGLDIIIHGAGTLRDGPVEGLSDDDRRAVLGPKIDGTANLFAATRDDPPQTWIALSSVVARMGNAGQTLYGAANAVLEEWRHPTAERSLAISFTAWSGVGMASDPAMLALLTSRGIQPLSVAEGAGAFRRILLAESPPEVVTVTAQPLPGAVPTPWPLGALRVLTADRVEVTIPLDADDDVLDHHQVGGRPLVPAALWLCAFKEAAQLVDAGPGARFLDDVIVHLPTFVEGTRTDVYASVRRAGDHWLGQIYAGETLVAEARVGRCAWSKRTAPPEPLGGGEDAAPLYRSDLLFHGPHWQILRRIEDGNDGDPRADLVAPDGLGGVAATIDGAHQLLSMWSGKKTGWLGLPVGASRWIIADEVSGALRLTTHAHVHESGVIGDIEATDAQGRVVLRGEGVTLRPAARWPEVTND